MQRLTEVRKQKSLADLQMESLDEPSGIVCVCVWVGWFNGIYLLPWIQRIMTGAFYCILFGSETEEEAGKNADATIIVIVWLVWGG